MYSARAAGLRLRVLTGKRAPVCREPAHRLPSLPCLLHPPTTSKAAVLPRRFPNPCRIGIRSSHCRCFDMFLWSCGIWHAHHLELALPGAARELMRVQNMNTILLDLETIYRG